MHFTFVGRNDPPMDVFFASFGKTSLKTLRPLEGKIMNEEILGQLERLLRQEIKNLAVGGDFEKIEQAVMEKMTLLGQGLLQRLVDSGTNGYQSSSILCTCGGSMRFIQHRRGELHSLFGWIGLKRAYYHCPDCGSSSVPWRCRPPGARK